MICCSKNLNSTKIQNMKTIFETLFTCGLMTWATLVKMRKRKKRGTIINNNVRTILHIDV